MLPVIERTSDLAPELLPEVSPTGEGYWTALRAGELRAQRCTTCGRFRVPAAPVCPTCHDAGYEWTLLDGAATVFSWIRYHKQYLPTYDDVPYTVVTAELREGVRMYGRLLDDSGNQSRRRPEIGEPVHAVLELWHNDRHTVAFQEGPRQ